VIGRWNGPSPEDFASVMLAELGASTASDTQFGVLDVRSR
jgi:hypothetical protein